MEGTRLKVKAFLTVIKKQAVNSWGNLNGIDVLETNASILFHLGLWPLKETRKSWGGLFRYLYPRVLIICELYQSVVTVGMDLVLNLKSPLAITECIFVIFVRVMIVGKTATFLARSLEMKRLFSGMKRFERLEYRNSEYTKSVARKGHVLTKVMSTVVPALITTSSLVMLALVAGRSLYTRNMPFRGWYPYDINASPFFELTLIFRLALFAIGLNIIIICDSVLIAILIQVVVKFKILRYNLKNIRKDAVKKVEELFRGRQMGKWVAERWVENPRRRSEVRRAQTCLTILAQPVDVEDASTRVNRFRATKHLVVERNNRRTTSQHELLKERLREEMRSAVNEEMERSLAKYVTTHGQLIRYMEELESLFTPFFIIQFLCNLIPTGICGAYTALVAHYDVKVVGFVIISLVCMIELYLFCRLSTEITKESANVKRSIYESDWFEASRSFKQSMRIIISRSNQPVVIRVAEFVSLSMTTFSHITRMAYRYYMVYVNVTQQNNNNNNNNVTEAKV